MLHDGVYVEAYTKSPVVLCELDLKQCIDICKSVENATTHMGVFGTQKEEIMVVSNQGRFAGKTRGEGRPRRERGSGKLTSDRTSPNANFVCEITS